MTLKDFVNKYKNKPLEWVDPNNKNQCMDLVVAWIEEGLGHSRLTNGIFYAYQLFTNPTLLLKENFEIIPNTPTGVPQAGDIMVWSAAYGPAGHTAIVTQGDALAFKAFSQNDPTGSPCVERIYGYNKVLGWLRSKKNNPLQECLSQHTTLVTKLIAYEKKEKDWISTEQRLKDEKDQALRELQVKLDTLFANHKSLCHQKQTYYKNKLLANINSAIQATPLED